MMGAFIVDLGLAKYNDNKIDNIKDRVLRAWGILTNCYKISVEESIKLLGEIKIGVALDIIKLSSLISFFMLLIYVNISINYF